MTDGHAGIATVSVSYLEKADYLATIVSLRKRGKNRDVSNFSKTTTLLINAKRNKRDYKTEIRIIKQKYGLFSRVGKKTPK